MPLEEGKCPRIEGLNYQEDKIRKGLTVEVPDKPTNQHLNTWGSGGYREIRRRDGLSRGRVFMPFLGTGRDYLEIHFLLLFCSFQLLPWQPSSTGARRMDYQHIKGYGGGISPAVISEPISVSLPSRASDPHSYLALQDKQVRGHVGSTWGN